MQEIRNTSISVAMIGIILSIMQYSMPFLATFPERMEKFALIAMMLLNIIFWIIAIKYVYIIKSTKQAYLYSRLMVAVALVGAFLFLFLGFIFINMDIKNPKANFSQLLLGISYSWATIYSIKLALYESIRKAGLRDLHP